MSLRMLLFAVLAALPVAGCSLDQQTAERPGYPLFAGMGPHTRLVATRSLLAQRYFDQGLNWAFAFNHDEAIRAFEAAGLEDPSCAMAYWGAALCHGPHINYPMMPEERSRLAWQALELARAHRSGATPVEQALIDALGARYQWPAPADRASLDRAYADAMRSVHQRFPDDADVAVLYAESLMDLQPWDLWELDGRPKGRTTEICRTLEGVLARNPRHPGAAHLYIHAVEASRTPERAVAAADVLRSLVPASGHLVHMPSHIDIRVGQWPEAARTNRRAIAADSAYTRRVPRQGFYNVYMVHNHQFLAFTCMMMGRSEEAIAAARRSHDMLPADWVKENAGAIDGYMTLHMEALKRFGRWKELLELPSPPEHLPYTRAMWRCNRAVALAALGRPDEAAQEAVRFDDAVKAVPNEALAQINPAHTVLRLAGYVLRGEIAFARGDHDAALRELHKAREIEDNLKYMEPPDWVLPTRHTIGAVALAAGRVDHAELAYRQDQETWPGNGWSLLGLARVHEARGNAGEAARARAAFQTAWRHADMTPHDSCLCAPSAAPQSDPARPR